MGLLENYEVDYSELENAKLENKKILVQLPSGLKGYKDEIKNALTEITKGNLYFQLEECYGACDVKNMPEFDAIIQLGHERIDNVLYPQKMYFVKLYKKIDNLNGFPNLLSILNIADIKSIVIVYTITYKKIAYDVGEKLKKHKISITYPNGDKRVNSSPIVLGCNFSPLKYIENEDIVLYIGDGMFHPIPMAVITSKLVIAYNPSTGEIADISKSKRDFIKERENVIKRGYFVKNWAIVISIKLGQNREKYAIALKKMAEKKGVNAEIYVTDYLKPEDFIGAKIEGIVSTACSRIAIDDYERYPIPILTPFEFMVVLGYRQFKEYTFDEIY
ncbi:MAG: diphthamide biosynthesis enzyme Dph2 [Thermoplasmata archaeon]